MYCQKCGANVKEGSVFCIKCGNKIADAMENKYVDINSSGKPHNSQRKASINIASEKKFDKKWLYACIGVLAAVIILVIGMFVFRRIKSGISNKNTRFSTVLDQSELRWYITQNYGDNGDLNYRYYDYSISEGGDSFLIAKRIDSNKHCPMYIVQCLDDGMSDWYLFRDDERWNWMSRNIFEYQEDVYDSGIAKLKLSGSDYDCYLYIIEKGSDIWRIGLTFDETEMYISTEFYYDNSGMFESCDNTYYLKSEEFISKTTMEPGSISEYVYNEDGTLMEYSIKNHVKGVPATEKGTLAYYQDDIETSVHYLFSYDNAGFRTMIVSDGKYYGNEKMEYRRNEDGNAVYVKYVDLDNGYDAGYYIDYNDDGRTKISREEAKASVISEARPITEMAPAATEEWNYEEDSKIGKSTDNNSDYPDEEKGDHDNDLLSKFRINPSTIEDYSANLDPDEYCHYDSDIEGFSFFYPAGLFNYVKVDNSNEQMSYGQNIRTITFYGSNGSVLSYAVYRRTDGRSLSDAVNTVHDFEHDQYYNLTDILVKVDEEKGGKIVTAGEMDSVGDYRIYDLIRITDELVYRMISIHLTHHNEEERLKYAYVTENEYRMCGFSGSTKQPRSFEEYLEDGD